MKRYFVKPAALAAAILTLACTEQEIPVYDASNAALYFSTNGAEFSLKSVSTETADLSITLNMFGPICDYDRQVEIEFPDSTWNDAVQGVDFELVEALVPAGETSGRIVLNVQNPDDLDSKTTTVALVPNEDFPYTVNTKNYVKVHWSKEYVRPSNTYVWTSWYLFFSQGYSRRYHQLLIDRFGEEIEISSHMSGARNDTTCQYKVISWWYSANREFYDYVKEHDQDNPDDPYMHSDDYEYYSSRTLPVGSGTTPDVIPTILSTLNVL